MNLPLAPLAPVVYHTVIVYLFLILMFRYIGRRQLGQLNVIDLVIIILMGSAVETAMVNGNTTLPAGIVCSSTLLAFNGLLAFTLLKSRRFRHGLLGGPMLLVHDGMFVETNLRKCGLTQSEVLQALRGREQPDLSDVRFATLELDGEITVVTMHTDVKVTEPVASRIGPQPKRHRPKADPSL